MDTGIHEGHRARLLKRFSEHGDSLLDHELLEIILFNVIPRKNTNGVAHALLREFGSLAGVLRADVTALCCVEGVGPATAAYLRCVAAVAERAKSSPLDHFPRTGNFSEFSSLLMDRLGVLKYECIELFAADSGGYVIGTERFSSQEYDTASMEPKQILQFFVKYRPSALLVAHNHIDCTSKPSRDDDLFTRRLLAICNLHGIRLLDHIIVGKNDLYSYYMNRRFEYIKSLPLDL